MNQTLKNQIEKTFSLAFLDFKDEKDVLNFLNNFLTKKEFEILSKRLAVIYWLSKKRNYSNIETNLKVSSSTIADCKKLVNNKEVIKIIKKIDADEWAQNWSSRLKELLKL